MAKILIMKDVVVAKNFRFRCTPNSRRLSENIIRGGSFGPQTSSARGRTAAVPRLAGVTSFTSGSWISIVATGNLPAFALPQLLSNLWRQGMCHQRSHHRFSQGHLRPRQEARQMALITVLRDLNHGFVNPS
jgi:hypothetical protein